MALPAHDEGLARAGSGGAPAPADPQQQPVACSALSREQKHRRDDVKRSILSLAVLAAGLCLLASGLYWAVLRSLPPFTPEELAALSHFPPRTLADLVSQRDILVRYARSSPAAVAAGYCGSYILMQTFAIPGTIMLSLLAGGLYGVWRGSVLVAVVSTLGSCSCYCMSWMVGQPLAHALWPDRLDRYAAEVAGRRRWELLNFVVFLRVTPILPNTFINVASPIVGMPLLPFFLGTLLGCLPNNLVAVNAGSHLGELRSLQDLYSIRLVVLGAAVGLAALAPIYLKRRSERAAAKAAKAA